MDLKQREKVTLALSFIAYTGFTDTEPEKVFDELKAVLKFFDPYIGKYHIVWGPAAHKLELEKFDDGLMFVVQDKENPEQYTVVIRGTNPVSLASWVFEDLWVREQSQWATGSAPEGAKISDSTRLALSILQDTRPSSGMPGEGTSILEFLSDAINNSSEKITVVVTGHSLGGAIAPTLALWLSDVAPGCWVQDKADIYAFTYAGPTAGNKEFAQYSDSILGEKCYRFANYYDVVTHAWNEDSLKQVDILYDPIPLGVFDIIIDLACKSVEGKGYTQIEQKQAIGSQVVTFLDNFPEQMIYQHIGPYIIRLIKLISESNKDIDVDELIGALEIKKLIEHSPLYKHWDEFMDFMRQKAV